MRLDNPLSKKLYEKEESIFIYSSFYILFPFVFCLLVTLFYAKTCLIKVISLVPLILIAGTSLHDIDIICNCPKQLEYTFHVFVTLIVLSYCILFVLLSLWTNQTTFPNFTATLVLACIMDTLLTNSYFLNSLLEAYISFKEVCYFNVLKFFIFLFKTI